MTHADTDGTLESYRSTGLPGTLIDLESNPGIDPEIAQHLAAIRGTLTAELDDSKLFLSVIMRTQGTRVESLKDALLCLAAQTDQDFELILVIHNAEPSAAAEVHAALEIQPERLASKLRTVDASGGLRGVPLNIGLGVARGQYVVFYDDDDLLSADWVETFHRAARAAPGAAVRAIAATQQVTREPWPEGQDGFRTMSWPRAEYAERFDLLNHLRINHTPFMSIAFPAVLFSRFGFAFDETLLVCEDWDIVVKAGSLVGVTDAWALTSIYRRWTRATSSYTLHSSDEWRDSEQRVIDGFAAARLVVPPGTSDTIRSLLNDRDAFAGVLASRSWRWSRPLRGVQRALRRVRAVVRGIIRR